MPDQPSISLPADTEMLCAQTVDAEQVKAFLQQFQAQLSEQLELLDGQGKFIADSWQREQGGGGESRVLSDGQLFEQAGVNFSHVHGAQMPASATAHRPELAGRSFEAMGVSIVIHPKNPHIPTTHANVRFFIAHKEGEEPVWWFGGGFDLTPYYPVDEDVLHWHQTAKDLCTPFGEAVYSEYKQWCDAYFFLPHRQETRGVGGLFFDDLNQWGFGRSFEFMRDVAQGFIKGYQPIVERRQHTPFTDQQRQFQLYRRGRYVEFNLVYDRGTLFGLQSGGRTESILMSMPPLVRWQYSYTPAPDSLEQKLYQDYLRPRDWLNELKQANSANN